MPSYLKISEQQLSLELQPGEAWPSAADRSVHPCVRMHYLRRSLHVCLTNGIASSQSEKRKHLVPFYEEMAEEYRRYIQLCREELAAMLQRRVYPYIPVSVTLPHNVS
ncbi:MAG: hypothetical protein AAB853_01235 [Patescibacteria group bacterium]